MVKPGGNGEQNEDAIVWSLDKGAPSTPSFLVIRDRVLLVNDGGVAMCLDAKSGEVLWRERLGGNFSASPVYAGGRVYCFNHDAVCTVLDAGGEYRKLAENQLDGEVRASPAISGKALFVRTKTHLYRIGYRERNRD